jgi:cytochrome c553
MPPTSAVLRCSLIALAIAGGAYAGLRTGSVSATQAQPPLTPRADRAAFMQQHFASVMKLHEAVIRGDLKMARTEARTIADRPDPPGLPKTAAPYVVSMQRAAARAADDEELEDLATSTAAMLATCGDCHRAVGTMPAPSLPASPTVGGTVGHMLAHKAAVDLMVQGLTVPSTSSWNQGAEQLQSAPLRRSELPKDTKLTREILEHEKRVHALAERGLAEADVRSRIYVYSELIQSCASCHALHGNVWGPGKP